MKKFQCWTRHRSDNAEWYELFATDLPERFQQWLFSLMLHDTGANEYRLLIHQDGMEKMLFSLQRVPIEML